MRSSKKTSQTPANEVIPSAESKKSELDYYLTILNDEKADPLLWWQAHGSEFPTLYEMARDFLTIQATSVASEQVFSIAGHTITKTQNKLLPETARALLYMKSWISNNLVKEM
ncbi:zinc finger BED domain-containing protein RICESLEEPER 2-like [Rhizophagus clarus]|uniref:Zinc finger BED domain-containing protein RICESLEEPER 2-like n=1 Tax=Rhizophagus clarus TaxID=94130 RepID=A0A8H3MEQ7_9GLOM|nr:zinc finger BED domain-containing protein RICESLEEPER 2-like [Rhizophagus clarus]